jgi:putative CRISPR-associated protein (TIGR02619 family)
MEPLLKVLEALLNWVGLKWGRKRELLRIYREAAKRTCNKYGLQHDKILPVFDDRNFQEILLRGRHTEHDELEEMKKLVWQTGIVPDYLLESFIEELSNFAIDGMEESLFWKERARERIEERRKRKREPEPLPPPDETKPSPVGIFSLPPLPKGFVDRDGELDCLRKWLEDKEKSVLFIPAIAGRGKTALASKLFDHARNSGQWEVRWVDCKNSLATLDGILVTFAQEWAKETDTDTSAEDDQYHKQLTDTTYPYENRLDALIRWLERKQWLIVLDNYHLAHEALRQMVVAIDRKAARTKLLLVGREEPPELKDPELPTGAHECLSLKPLPPEFAHAYLVACEMQLQKLTTPQVSAIYQKCGGEPEAMKLFAFAARRRSVDELLNMDLPDWSSGTQRWLDELTEVLTESERSALRAACIFSEPTERPLLEAVCAAIGVSDTADAVDGLIDARLLELDESKRLSLHDILRDYLRSKLGQEAKPLHTLAAQWLDDERSQIKQQTSKDVMEWDESTRHQWADRTRRAFYHWQEAGEPAKALACAEELWTVAEDPRLLCRQALDLCGQSGHDEARAIWLRREAALLYDEQQAAAAEDRYRQSLELDQRAGNRLGQAQTAAALAWLCLEGGRYDEAEDFANHSRLLSVQIGDTLTQAAALHVMGLVEEAYRHFPEALTWLKTARSLLRQSGLESDELQEEIERVRRSVSMRTILTTVGTSLLSNAKRDFNEQQPNEQQLANYLSHTDAAKASAETNSLSRLLTEGDDRIVFLRSQTDEGEQCAEALARHYANAEYETRTIEVPDLNYTESRFKMRGLRSLVATLIDQIRREKAQGREVLINATGGFKAEIAYATLVGLLFNVPVYYIHEAFREIIKMPPTPISWDYSLLADCDEFFEWIDADLRPTAEVDTRLRGLPEEVRLLLAEEEGFTLLSPAGEAFYEAYLDRVEQAIPESVLLSAQAWDTYRAAAPDVRQVFDRGLRKLALRELRLGGSDRVRNCDCLVYPKGHRDERLFFFEGEDGNVRVCELSRHSDGSYERMIARGVRRDDYQDFQPWRKGGRGA